MGVGYLILREIPIRNFYARSLMWFGVFGLIWENYRFRILSFDMKSRYPLVTPEHWYNQYKIFDFYQSANFQLKNNSNLGISPYDQWKLNQPGYFNHNITCFSTFFKKIKKEREITWDGTMNQPVLPMFDKDHPDAAFYR